jgi:DNA-binding CsgD family transcriptional regulator
VRAVGAREKEIMKQLADGRTTAEIFGLAGKS